MHLDNGLAAPCMGDGAWVGAWCLLGGRGRGVYRATMSLLFGKLLLGMILWGNL